MTTVVFLIVCFFVGFFWFLFLSEQEAGLACGRQASAGREGKCSRHCAAGPWELWGHRLLQHPTLWMAIRQPKLRGGGGCLYPPRRNQFSNKNLKVGMQFLKSDMHCPGPPKSSVFTEGVWKQSKDSAGLSRTVRQQGTVLPTKTCKGTCF